MAVEVRYVGTRHLQPWQTVNYNEANVIENGFLNEFRSAQANLQAHVAAGCGRTGQPACSFAYRGAGTGTVPLPIYLAYLNGQSAANAANAALYTGGSWTSTNFTTPLATYNPNPFTPAGTNSNTGLDGDATRRANAARAGLPANFFRANPDLLGGANVTGNGGYTQIQLAADRPDQAAVAWAAVPGELRLRRRHGRRIAIPSGRRTERRSTPRRKEASRTPSRATGCTSCRSARGDGS